MAWRATCSVLVLLTFLAIIDIVGNPFSGVGRFDLFLSALVLCPITGFNAWREHRAARAAVIASVTSTSFHQ